MDSLFPLFPLCRIGLDGPLPTTVRPFIRCCGGIRGAFDSFTMAWPAPVRLWSLLLVVVSDTGCLDSQDQGYVVYNQLWPGTNCPAIAFDPNATPPIPPKTLACPVSG